MPESLRVSGFNLAGYNKCSTKARGLAYQAGVIFGRLTVKALTNTVIGLLLAVCTLFHGGYATRYDNAAIVYHHYVVGGERIYPTTASLKRTEQLVAEVYLLLN
jgi:hypothetical protein